jgi:hypothetical protein
LATALDKAFENIDCMIAILCCQAKNRFYESTQRLIQPRRVLWPRGVFSTAVVCLLVSDYVRQVRHLRQPPILRAFSLSHLHGTRETTWDGRTGPVSRGADPPL